MTRSPIKRILKNAGEADLARILIAEDEAIVAMELEEVLKGMGYEVVAVVDSGDALLKAAVDGKPDLVLLDIKLKSFIDGIDAATRLRMFSEVPIIYLTAFNSAEMRDRAAKTQPMAYLVKPFDESSLRREVERALAKP
jgi:two-component system, response regulator PdtaR